MALTITYQVTNGEFPITVTLASTSDPLTIIATNIHTALDGYGEYTFDSVPEDNYILTFTDAAGCTFPLTICDLSAEITGVVYACEFDFDIVWNMVIPSPSQTRSVTPSVTRSVTPSRTPSRTPSITPSPSRVLSVTPSITPTLTPLATTSVTPSVTPSITPTPSVTPSITPTLTPLATSSVTPTITSSITLTPTITRTPSKTPTLSIIASRTPTPTRTLTPSTSPPAPKLEITLVLNYACTPLFGSYVIGINITGGTAPYQYSIDNGVTLTAPTNATTYAFTVAPGGTHNIYVQDSAGQIYIWEEIYCGTIYLEIIPIYLTPTASGFYRYFYDGNPSHYFDLTQGTAVSQPYGTVRNMVGYPAVGTTFLGWSYELADRFTINNITWITEGTNLTYTFRTNGIRLYAYFTDNGPISLDFCFNGSSDPTVISETDKEQVCTVCSDNGGTTVTVYFNPTLYLANGIEGVTWYSNTALTIPVANGYYVDGSTAFSTIYGVSNNGVTITNLGICDGGESECP